MGDVNVVVNVGAGVDDDDGDVFDGVDVVDDDAGDTFAFGVNDVGENV